MGCSPADSVLANVIDAQSKISAGSAACLRTVGVVIAPLTAPLRDSSVALSTGEAPQTLVIPEALRIATAWVSKALRWGVVHFTSAYANHEQDQRSCRTKDESCSRFLKHARE